MKVSDLASARVAIWGAGNEGLAAARALRSRFPEKTLAIIEESSQALPEWLLADGRIEARMGPVDPDVLIRFEVIIRSPGVSIYRDDIRQARHAGVRFTTGTNLWFAENVARHTVCITGSKGKSTTTHLVHHLLEASGKTAKMAGNMGLPLLSSLDRDNAAAIHVVELSSYQISDFSGAPSVAVLLNLYPEHLDWHRGEDNYYRDKASLFANVTRARVLNRQDEQARRYAEHFGAPVYFNSPEGFHHDGNTVYSGQEPWMSLSDLQLLGTHNLSNVCAALTAVGECGISLDRETVRAALRLFKGLNHRLTPLGERDGVLYVNDSIATIPQATVAALKTFAHRATTVLVGGYDRGLNQRDFAGSIIGESPLAVITLPGTGNELYRELQAICSSCGRSATRTAVYEGADLQQAVRLARELTPPGGVVLLSPGAPSFNSHRNFAERGEAFARAAGLPFQTES